MARWLWVSWGVILCMTLAPAIGGDAPVALTDRPASPGMVAQLTLDGPIGPAAAEYFDEASKRAVADGAAAIVLRLDTPGGLLDSMRQIIARMLACKIPVLVYVAPERSAGGLRRHLYSLRRADRRDGPGDARGCGDAGEPGRQRPVGRMPTSRPSKAILPGRKGRPRTAMPSRTRC